MSVPITKDGVKMAAEIAGEAVKVVPEVYKDLLQPAVKATGKGLGTIAETVTSALLPLRLMVWSFDQLEVCLKEGLEKRFKGLSPDRLVTPNPIVAVPALEALRYTAQEPLLRELYLNLLATAMDKEVAGSAHPAFVDIIRQMTPDEARIAKVLSRAPTFPIITLLAHEKDGGFNEHLPHFSLLGQHAGCQVPKQTAVYLRNLARLELVEIVKDQRFNDIGEYKEIEAAEAVVSTKKALELLQKRVEIRQELLNVTAFGRQFLDACTSKDVGA